MRRGRTRWHLSPQIGAHRSQDSLKIQLSRGVSASRTDSWAPKSADLTHCEGSPNVHKLLESPYCPESKAHCGAPQSLCCYKAMTTRAVYTAMTKQVCRTSPVQLQVSQLSPHFLLLSVPYQCPPRESKEVKGSSKVVEGDSSFIST